MKVTIDPQELTLFKYVQGDEDIPEFMVFESFKEAKNYLITQCEIRLNALYKLSTKDIK